MISAWVLEHVGAPLLKFGAIFLAVLAAIFGIRQWGKNAERMEQQQQNFTRAIERNRINSRDVSGPDTDNWLRAPEARR